MSTNFSFSEFTLIVRLGQLKLLAALRPTGTLVSW